MKKYENEFVPLGKIINDQINDMRSKFEFDKNNNLTKKVRNDNWQV